MKLSQRWRQVSLPNKLMVVSTAIMAVATLFLVVAAVLQYLAARDQLKVVGEQANIAQRTLESMNDSSKQTERLIKANEALAEQNSELVKHAGEQANASHTLADASQTQANASTVQAQAAKQSIGFAASSARAAEQSVRISEQAIIIGNRAYLSFDEIGIDDLVAGKRALPYIVWSNDGNSSAEISGVIQFGIRPNVLRSCDYSDPSTAPIAPLVISPHKAKRQRFSIEAPTSAQIEAIENESMYFVMCGRANYVTLGKSYPLEFCMYYSTKFKSFLQCE
jgi:hypothetical protein